MVTTVEWSGGVAEMADGDGLAEPGGIAWDGSRLFVADTNNHAIKALEPATGRVSTIVFEHRADVDNAPMADSAADAGDGGDDDNDNDDDDEDDAEAVSRVRLAAPADRGDASVVRFEFALPPGLKQNPDGPSHWKVTKVADGVMVETVDPSNSDGGWTAVEARQKVPIEAYDAPVVVRVSGDPDTETDAFSWTARLYACRCVHAVRACRVRVCSTCGCCL